MQMYLTHSASQRCAEKKARESNINMSVLRRTTLPSDMGSMPGLYSLLESYHMRFIPLI